MSENRHIVSACFEPPQTGGADGPRVGRDLSAEQAVVRGTRILLVEDQESVRAALRMMLELDGHQVTEAGNGAEGLNSFTAGQFDLVITDFEMPVMKGNELAAGIKLLAPSLPILMITASERARGEVENPVDAFLDKPLRVTDLRCALRKLLSARPEPAQPCVVHTLESPPVTFAPEGRILAPLQA
jgi:CheY-like chemotaxis protein